ncbi:DUF3800 domain-containing protein [Oceanibacterium hippocampi]|uniref:Uncharacterized protein n=1 Tax=Oceanibacterium hippocampi TaxID=745714 RepID=A0A1Y5SN54_9PROT|nr:DUF3800 domain-containing protein [Oceanibacterium hippocampi]SLN43942.1 hypothetical protein OCH7691_01844 [Oceanibacterium hippocampi]
MVIGGVLCKAPIARDLRAATMSAKGDFPDALKWTRIRRGNYLRYERLIDQFFDFNKEHLVDFHAAVVKTSDTDHATFNDGDSELGFNKFVIQHLFAFKRNMGKSGRIRHLYANRNSRHDLGKFNEYLNGMGRARFGKDCSPCLSVDHIDYREEPVFWISDILIGAIGASLNGRLGANSPKERMADHIRRRACLLSLTEESPIDKRHFKIWHIKLSKGPQGPSHNSVAVSGSTQPFGPRGYLDYRKKL